MRPRPAGGSESGALLVEALVGLGLLTMTTMAIGVVHRVTDEAQARIAERRAAIGVAQEVLETGGSVPPSADGTVSARLDVAVDATATTTVATGCGSQLGAGPGQLRVRVDGPERAGAAPTILPGTRGPTAPSTSPTVPVHVRMPAAVAATVIHVALVGPAGVAVPALQVGERCWRADVPPGTHHVLATAAEGTTLIDPTHVPHQVRPPRLTVTGGTVTTAVDVRAAASLTVDVATGGARLPDEAGAGLVWTVRGDDRREPTELGAARDVHPGVVAVTVSTCRNADAPGSTGTATVDPGTSATITAALATVEIDGVGLRTSETLAAYSLQGCGDGSTRRPVLRWHGGLYDGLRIALPHGMWQLRLETPDGARLTSPVTVAADGSVRTVDL